MYLGSQCPVLTGIHRSASLGRLDEFIQRCEAFVLDLAALHPVFESLQLLRPRAKADPKTPLDVSALRPWLLENAWDRQAPNLYTELDARRQPTAGSVGPFSLSLGREKESGDPIYVMVSNDYFSAARGHAEGRCVIMLPERGHEEFRTGELPLRLLACVNEHWPLAFAHLGVGGVRDAVNQSGPREQWVDTLGIGWLTYVNDPSVAEALPQDIAVQRLGTGIVFQIGERMPGPEDTARVDDMRRVRQALGTAGKLGTRHLR